MDDFAVSEANMAGHQPEMTLVRVPPTQNPTVHQNRSSKYLFEG